MSDVLDRADPGDGAWPIDQLPRGRTSVSSARGPLIVGGGFSGTMVAVQLARRGISSTLIDASERPGRGIAYSTKAACHRLNVRAANMSAFPDQPGHFAAYHRSKGGQAGSFARRADYGDYLEAILAPWVGQGLVTPVRGRAVSARPTRSEWQVDLQDGRMLRGGLLVLALGNAPPAPLQIARSIPADDVLNDIWSSQARPRLERAAENNEPILIAGSGLTMVDTVLALDAAGHRAPITVVSRHGLIPASHAEGTGPAAVPVSLDDLPRSLSRMQRWLRSRASAERDWRTAIDALRPITQRLWQRMDRSTRKRFLRHARPWWDVHRHRIAPDVHSRIAAMRTEGRLAVLTATIVDGRAHDDGYLIGVKLRGSGWHKEIKASLIVNCTGPLMSVRRSEDHLIRQMMADELLQPDDLDIGVAIDGMDRLAGRDDAYVIGPITRGHYWEVTAVPDIRVKVAEITAAISTVVHAKGS